MHKLLSENMGQSLLSESDIAPDPRSTQRAEAARTLARLMAGVESIPPISHDVPDSFHPVMADSARSNMAGPEAAPDIQVTTQDHASRLTP